MFRHTGANTHKYLVSFLVSEPSRKKTIKNSPKTHFKLNLLLAACFTNDEILIFTAKFLNHLNLRICKRWCISCCGATRMNQPTEKPILKAIKLGFCTKSGLT